MPALYGIDISHHNYSLLKVDGYLRGKLRERALLGFVLMKATEGCTYQDPRFNEYVNAIGEGMIMRDGVQVGAYHYARPENNLPESEARFFVQNVARYAGHMVYALDVEGRALDMPDIDGWAYRWLTAVYRETGVKPMIYLQKSALKLFEKCAAGDFGLWCAAWQKQKPANVRPWPFAAIWQNNGRDLDTDYFFGSPQQWRKYAAVVK